MDNLRASIEILLARGNVQQVLNEWYSLPELKSIDKQAIKSRFVSAHQNDYKQRYNDNQVENIFNILDNKWQRFPSANGKSNDVHPIYVLLNFSNVVLTEREDDPYCLFHHLFRWRDVTLKLGEDMFTTAYLAFRDANCSRSRNYFGWGAPISNDNSSLNYLFKTDRLSDLHFHLRGSTHIFDLNWLSLMNNTLNRSDKFSEIQQFCSPDIKFETEEHISSLHTLSIKAAAIRLLLFSFLIGDGEIGLDNSTINLILREPDEKLLKFSLNELQSFINFFQMEYGQKINNEVVDYAIPKNLTDREQGNISAVSYHGERKLLYEAFRYIFEAKKEYKFIRTLLYAYLIAKNRVRKELIQQNERIGFKNFKNYQDRKEFFIPENSIYEKLVSHIAIESSLAPGNVDYIEARITPGDRVDTLTQAIAKYDKDILHINDDLISKLSDTGSCNGKEQIRHYYILHFIKGADKVLNSYSASVYSRSFSLRERVKQQTFAINEVRKSVHSLRDRVVGIDAAGAEIGCRPEIFATAYRYLKNYTYNSKFQYLTDDIFYRLGFTYHVGEDFLDLVDGLRAIDEAILFLNLSDGDRIGHGLALGVDPQMYYNSRNMRIIMTNQDFLDNVSWMLAMIPQTGGKESSKIISKLENWFYKYYHKIYNNSANITPYLYHQAWKLRGDDPKHYSKPNPNNERFEPKFTNFWSKSGINENPDLDVERKDDIIAIYRDYHYNHSVKENGAEMCEEEICIDYIEAVRAIQRLICKKIAEKHIIVEVNPTSNILIGDHKRYDKHPLVKLFNSSLTGPNEQIDSSHQIHITIGTDDRGVFATSLEMEFSLMALAMGKSKDINDARIYGHSNICQWLSHISKFGHEHKFYHKKKQ